MESQLCRMSLYFGGMVAFHPARSDLPVNREVKNRAIKDENTGRVTAVLNENRSAGCRSAKELTGILKTAVRRIVRNDLGKKQTLPRQRRVSHEENLIGMVKNIEKSFTSIYYGWRELVFYQRPRNKTAKRTAGRWQLVVTIKISISKTKVALTVCPITIPWVLWERYWSHLSKEVRSAV